MSQTLTVVRDRVFDIVTVTVTVTVTRLRVLQPRIRCPDFQQGQNVFFSEGPNQLWGPPSLLSVMRPGSKAVKNEWS